MNIMSRIRDVNDNILLLIFMLYFFENIPLIVIVCKS